MPYSWISRDWKWVERKNRAALPRLPDRRRVVIFDPTQEIGPGIGAFTDQVELVTTTSLDEAIADVKKTPRMPSCWAQTGPKTFSRCSG